MKVGGKLFAPLGIVRFGLEHVEVEIEKHPKTPKLAYTSGNASDIGDFRKLSKATILLRLGKK